MIADDSGELVDELDGNVDEQRLGGENLQRQRTLGCCFVLCFSPRSRKYCFVDMFYLFSAILAQLHAGSMSSDSLVEVNQEANSVRRLTFTTSQNSFIACSTLKTGHCVAAFASSSAHARQIVARDHCCCCCCW